MLIDLTFCGCPKMTLHLTLMEEISFPPSLPSFISELRTPGKLSLTLPAFAGNSLGPWDECMYRKM